MNYGSNKKILFPSTAEMDELQDGDVKDGRSRKSDFVRNLIAFWIFGLCNNFAYVIMLSAAHDILQEQKGSNSTSQNKTVLNESRDCNKISTGAILLADVVPSFIIKLTAPFFMEKIPYGIRMTLVVVAQVASYLIVAFSPSIPLSLFGVVFAALGSGLGEISFLSLSSFFDKNVISTWSSGTGGAGVFGALAYAGITQAGVSPRNTILIMLVVPALFAISYWILAVIPPEVHRIKLLLPETWVVPKVSNVSHTLDESKTLTFKQKLTLIQPLLKYMIPLSLVYIGEYIINQGLQELIIFNDIWLSKDQQYRWYQVTYQIGVLISRSSVNVLTIPSKFLPLLAILQLSNAAIFFCEAYFRFMPSIWIVLVLISVEGLLGGSAYVNTFYQIKQQVEEQYAEFSLGVASVADSTGIVIAGFSSIPLHNWICKQPLLS